MSLAAHIDAWLSELGLVPIDRAERDGGFLAPASFNDEFALSYFEGQDLPVYDLMARRFVDLSIALEVGVHSDPPGMEPRITYFTHEHTYEQIAPFFPGLKREDLIDGMGEPAGAATAIEIMTEANASLFI